MSQKRITIVWNDGELSGISLKVDRESVAPIDTADLVALTPEINAALIAAHESAEADKAEAVAEVQAKLDEKKATLSELRTEKNAVIEELRTEKQGLVSQVIAARKVLNADGDDADALAQARHLLRDALRDARDKDRADKEATIARLQAELAAS